MPRCSCCHREINATTHQGDAFRVDGYRLHTGKTKRIQTAGDNGDKLDFLQLYEPHDVFVCVDCFARAEIQNVWLQTFPDTDQVERLGQ